MKLSKEKKEKVAEQVLAFLYQSFPQAKFTSEVAQELARDEEFIKNILFEVKEKNLVMAVRKNESGRDFIRRIRWQLSPAAYQAYDQKVKSGTINPQQLVEKAQKEAQYSKSASVTKSADMDSENSTANFENNSGKKDSI